MVIYKQYIKYIYSKTIALLNNFVNFTGFNDVKDYDSLRVNFANHLIYIQLLKNFRDYISQINDDNNSYYIDTINDVIKKAKENYNAKLNDLINYSIDPYVTEIFNQMLLEPII